jgi:clathrin heavy chain
LKNPNSADMQRVGDRCFDEKLYEAAKMFFTNIKNNAKIASCLVRLG